ncbi:MAG TPA: cupin domain-containing protein [Burkholderiales bacterium]|nr:cupin domain-containing protein [Burkholderiales bacterium]
MKPEKNFTIARNSRHATIADALDAVAKIREGIASAIVFEHGTLQVKMYRPSKVDLQKPHTRDEIYVIARGSGWFVNGGARHSFHAGDLLFVPAGLEHRFEEFTEDFCTWAMFYGAEGGEKIGLREQDQGLDTKQA